MEERRKYNRWRVEHKKAVLKDTSGMQEVPLIDLSSGGMKVILPYDIPLSTNLDGEFRVMPSIGTYLIRGKVVWTKPREQAEKQYDVGIEFEKINTVSS